jgi:hypothetical protein
MSRSRPRTTPARAAVEILFTAVALFVGVRLIVWAVDNPRITLALALIALAFAAIYVLNVALDVAADRMRVEGMRRAAARHAYYEALTSEEPAA